MRAPILLLILVPALAGRTAAAHPAAPAATALPIAPQPEPDSPPAEIALGAEQVLAGALATVGAGVGVLLAAATGSEPLVYAALAATPALGAWPICRLGQISDWYEGGCAGTLFGGYVGALAFGIGMGYVGTYLLAPVNPDGGYETAVGAAFGTALGVVVGTAIGATIGWHVSKHRRGAPPLVGAPVSPRPPLPSALDDGSLRRLAPAARGAVAFSVPLLSFAF